MGISNTRNWISEYKIWKYFLAAASKVLNHHQNMDINTKKVKSAHPKSKWSTVHDKSTFPIQKMQFYEEVHALAKTRKLHQWNH